MSTNTINNFLIAAKKKLRIDTSRGSLAPEDLFDLSLERLNDAAVQLDEAVSKLGRKSFIDRSPRDTNNLQLKFDVVKEVIDFKLAENVAAKERANKESRRAFLKSLAEKKEIAALEELSMEDIKKQLAELEEEPVAV